jgi:hypothetical protein
MTNDSTFPTFNYPKDLNEYIEKEEKAGRKIFAGETTSPTPENTSSERPPSGQPSKKQVTTSSTPSKSKKLANKNAVKHGGYCLGLLPWESREEFEALHTSLKEDWKPVGVMQRETVATLCQWMWTRRRVTQASEIKYFRSPVTEALKTGAVTWDDVVQYEASVPAQVETFVSSQTELAEKLSAVCDKIGEHHYWTNTTEGKELQLQLMKMQQEIHDLACSVRETVLGQDIQKAVDKITGLFDQAYQPEEIEKQATLLCMVDREIDRAIKRLIYLKTFCEDLARRNIPALESPPVTPPDSSESDHSPESAAKNIKTETDQ